MHGRWTGAVWLAYGLAGDMGHAEDIAQEAFTKAYAAWPRIAKMGNPDAYIRRIIVNENISRFRKRRVSERLAAIQPEPAEADATGAVDDRTVLIGALRRLGPRQRAVVVLRYWLDMSEAEVADLLDCSAGTVKSQASRALASLRTSAELTREGLQ